MESYRDLHRTGDRMSKDLLLEIGTEELPAKVVPRATSALEGFLRKNLESKKLSFASIETLGTPRRLTLIVRGLEERLTPALSSRGRRRRPPTTARASQPARFSALRARRGSSFLT